MEEKRTTEPKEIPGIMQPPAINPYLDVQRTVGQPIVHSVDEYVAGILSGDRVKLSRAITLIESTLPDHQGMAQVIIRTCLPHSGKSIRVGITGTPGVGKSTLIESLGGMLTQKGNRLAVLAIDPSSTQTKGSILGDKTRMATLANDPNAFIRPSPSAGTLGGVARKTRETIILCEAAGYDCIFVETVGVGQSEIAVHSMVDFFLVLLLPGSGDDLQGIKRGIMEMADALVINKADLFPQELILRIQSDYTHAMHFFPPHPGGWLVPVLPCSSTKETGLGNLWNILETYHTDMTLRGYWSEKRIAQSSYWLMETIHQHLIDRFHQYPGMEELLTRHEVLVREGRMSPFEASQRLLEWYYNRE